VREVRFVDRNDRKSGHFSTDVFRQYDKYLFTSLRRSDHTATIHKT